MGRKTWALIGAFVGFLLASIIFNVILYPLLYSVPMGIKSFLAWVTVALCGWRGFEYGKQREAQQLLNKSLSYGRECTSCGGVVSSSEELCNSCGSKLDTDKSP